jgi:hypothetical protein
MTLAKKEKLVPIGPIDPSHVYRTSLSVELFGVGPQRIRDLIRLKRLPTPMQLAGSATAQAWTGQQILDHRAMMQKLADDKLKADLAMGPRDQPDALVGARKKTNKIKKTKLRPPAQQHAKRREAAS